MNNSSSTPPKQEPLTLHIVQLSVGLVVTVFNVLVLLVFLSDRPLLKKSAYLIGVILGNLTVGLGYMIADIYRTYLAVTDQFYSPVTVPYCLMTTIPEWMITSFCLPAIVLFVIGIERIVALSKPAWYHSRWSQTYNWYVLWICIVIIALMVLTACVVSVWLKPTDAVPAHCSWSLLFGIEMGGVFFNFTVIAGTCAVICTMFGFCIGRQHFKKMPHLQGNSTARTRYQQQLRICKAMLSMACSDFVFVVIPNSIFSLTWVVHINIPTPLVVYFTYSYAINAIMNITVQFIFNSDFHKAAVKFLHLDKLPSCKKNQIDVPPSTQ